MTAQEIGFELNKLNYYRRKTRQRLRGVYLLGLFLAVCFGLNVGGAVANWEPANRHYVWFNYACYLMSTVVMVTSILVICKLIKLARQQVHILDTSIIKLCRVNESRTDGVLADYLDYQRISWEVWQSSFYRWWVTRLLTFFLPPMPDSKTEK